MLEHVAKHAQVFKLLFEDDTAHGLLQSSERRTREAASQRLAEIFRQGIAEGVFRPADPLMLANMYLGLCKGVFDSQPELEGREPAGERPPLDYGHVPERDCDREGRDVG